MSGGHDSRASRRFRSIAEIEAEIGRTRAKLDRSVAALDRSLGARRLVEKGAELMKYSLTHSEGWNRGLDVVRANPVPVALIGIGAAWLLANMTGAVDAVTGGGRSYAGDRHPAERLGGAESPSGGGKPAPEEPTLERLGGDGAAASGETGGWVHQVAGATRGAIRSARESSEAVLERASDYAGQAGESASRAADRVVDTFERYPLLIGGVGIVAGALAAALLPRTRTEDRWIGGTRDKLVEKAEETGHRAVVRLREKAERSGEAKPDGAGASASQPDERRGTE